MEEAQALHLGRHSQPQGVGVEAVPPSLGELGILRRGVLGIVDEKIRALGELPVSLEA